MVTEKEFSEAITFLQLSLSRMGDKRGVSADEVEVDADKDTIKIRKVIFKSAHFDRIRSFDSGIRKYIRGISFPYESGMHIIPLRMVERVTLSLQSFAQDRQILVETFADVYPYLIQEAQPKLRKLFNEGDYDPQAEVYSAFRMGWQFLRFDEPINLESINGKIFLQEKNKLQTRMNEAYEEARMVLRESCITLISNLRVALEPDAYGAPKRFSASTLRNLQEFLETFDLRNVTSDSQLQVFVTQAKSLVEGVDAEGLRTTDGFRQRIGDELHNIEQSITESMLVAPKRRIKRHGEER